MSTLTTLSSFLSATSKARSTSANRNVWVVMRVGSTRFICRLRCASRPRGGLGPRVAHGPVERVVRHLFPAVLGEGVVGAVGVLLELGERARLLLDLVGGARRDCGHGVVLAVGEEQQRRAA